MTLEEINNIKVIASTAGIYLHSAKSLEKISLSVGLSSKKSSIKKCI